MLKENKPLPIFCFLFIEGIIMQNDSHQNVHQMGHSGLQSVQMTSALNERAVLY